MSAARLDGTDDDSELSLPVAWDTLLLACPVAAGGGLTPELPRPKALPDKSNGCLGNCAVFMLPKGFRMSFTNSASLTDTGA